MRRCFNVIGVQSEYIYIYAFSEVVTDLDSVLSIIILVFV